MQNLSGRKTYQILKTGNDLFVQKTIHNLIKLFWPVRMNPMPRFGYRDDFNVGKHFIYQPAVGIKHMV